MMKLTATAVLLAVLIGIAGCISTDTQQEIARNHTATGAHPGEGIASLVAGRVGIGAGIGGVVGSVAGYMKANGQ
jgi:uncharacterized membrane protein YraQ (UPF0718 family)